MGFISKAKTGAGILSGYTATRFLISGTAKTVGGHADHVYALGKKAFAKPETGENVDFEDYLYSMTRRGIADPQGMLLRRSASAFWLMLAAGVGLAAVMLYTMPFSPVLFVGPSMFALVAASHAHANGSFRNRKFMTFREFLGSGDWIPRFSAR